MLNYKQNCKTIHKKRVDFFINCGIILLLRIGIGICFRPESQIDAELDPRGIDTAFIDQLSPLSLLTLMRDLQGSSCGFFYDLDKAGSTVVIKDIIAVSFILGANIPCQIPLSFFDLFLCEIQY